MANDRWSDVPVTFENVDAIRDYLNSKEQELRAKPEGGKVIDNFRKWYNSLSDWDKLYIPGVKGVEKIVGEAKWYRDKANQILGLALPEGWIPADAEYAARTPPPESDPTPPPPSIFEKIPTWVKVTAGVLLGLGVWHLFSYSDDDE